MCVCVSVCVCVLMHACMCSCVRVSSCMCTHACVRECMRACVLTVGTRDMCMFDIFIVISVLSCFFYIILKASRFRL